MNRLLILLFCCVTTTGLAQNSGVRLVKNRQPEGRIILCQNDSITRAAADLLQRFTGELSGAKPQIISLNSSTKRHKGDVYMGRLTPEDAALVIEDGFCLRTDEGTLSIGGKQNGIFYGVVALLEDYFGVDYLAAHTYTLTPRTELTLAPLHRIDNPAFRYRQTQCYAMQEDPLYKAWHRLEQPEEEFAGRMWVHTFNQLIPSEIYGKSHPEYYSYIHAERRPGRASQWCLSNPEVLELAVHRIDSVFRANPEMKMISVSQNDGNFTYCQCEKCRRITEEEGSPSGNYIRFMNQIAERFPDKQISTLAYLFTMQPPRHVRPLPNVNIMLCDIDCDREADLRHTVKGREFVAALEGWSVISKNLFIWDYGINFDNMVAPFPNFPILQSNIKLFKQHHATMHFSQIGGSKGGDFSEMRAYVVAKLMWNPDADVDSLMRHFMEGYYGKAASAIYRYEKMLEGALIGSGKRLWIYDSPVSHKEGMLNAACRRTYNALFEEAEAAVADDSARLARVRMARLPLQYSELEIARAEGIQDPVSTTAQLALFEERTAQFGVKTLNERANDPATYCTLYRERYLTTDPTNKAIGAKITWITPPSGNYAKMGEGALVDGLLGGTTYVENWVGWEGCDAQFTIDLGTPTAIKRVEADCLHQIGAWILFPIGIEIAVSDDGVNYRTFGTRSYGEERANQVRFARMGCTLEDPVTARYIRMTIVGTKLCPSWHYGVGHPSWIFVDEIFIK